jgi:hypothetical protein
MSFTLIRHLRQYKKCSLRNYPAIRWNFLKQCDLTIPHICGSFTHRNFLKSESTRSIHRMFFSLRVVMSMLIMTVFGFSCACAITIVMLFFTVLIRNNENEILSLKIRNGIGWYSIYGCVFETYERSNAHTINQTRLVAFYFCVNCDRLRVLFKRISDSINLRIVFLSGVVREREMNGLSYL